MTLHIQGDQATIEDVSGDPAETVRAALEELRGRDVTSLKVVLPAGDSEAVRAWRRLGFEDSSVELEASLETLDREVRDGQKSSYGAVYAQTDDQGAVAAAVERFVPQLFRSPATFVLPPSHGWVAVHNDVASRDPQRLRHLASELSQFTGGVVLALGVEEEAAVRLVAFERGRVMDEYLSRPEHYGPLPPGDVVALRINPRVLSRLTGAGTEAIRRAAADHLTPDELFRGLGDVLGLGDVALDAWDAAGVQGAITVEHP